MNATHKLASLQIELTAAKNTVAEYQAKIPVLEAQIAALKPLSDAEKAAAAPVAPVPAAAPAAQ